MSYDNSSYSYDKKRTHVPSNEDLETSPSDTIPRKRFISEENFAKDMAAMSLDSSNEFLPQSIPMYQSVYYQFYNPQIPPQTENTNDPNIIRIDDLDQFLSDDEENSSYMETNEQGRLIDQGLLLELKPGEKKPRIPDFVLSNQGTTELVDPRDKIAIGNILHPSKNVEIEILNHPTISSNSMDVD
ncbi:MAG: hypothetical protein EXX96DRAFT_343922 [Benjaminiella poitrasii]|nr:MAG: hypothetical protein EXX96DRAFT_343922 [Benjaminiella poitrasii]